MSAIAEVVTQCLNIPVLRPKLVVYQLYLFDSAITL